MSHRSPSRMMTLPASRRRSEKGSAAIAFWSSVERRLWLKSFLSRKSRPRGASSGGTIKSRLANRRGGGPGRPCPNDDSSSCVLRALPLKDARAARGLRRSRICRSAFSAALITDYIRKGGIHLATDGARRGRAMRGGLGRAVFQRAYQGRFPLRARPRPKALRAESWTPRMRRDASGGGSRAASAASRATLPVQPCGGGLKNIGRHNQVLARRGRILTGIYDLG